MLTAIDEVAFVVRTLVAVVADHRAASRTSSRLATVAGRTSVGVVTRGSIGDSDRIAVAARGVALSGVALIVECGAVDCCAFGIDIQRLLVPGRCLCHEMFALFVLPWLQHDDGKVHRTYFDHWFVH